MANQPKKYKKFVATAATATLVASAIAPMASAKSFSDVPENNEFQPFIDALSETGIINGYQDGTFKPGNKLTRGQVVKMLGRWVESNGQEAPADWNSVQRFNDVPVNSADEELVKYAALVKDAGVFTGSNGNLLASNNITRQQMAKVLNGAYAAVNGTSLVDLADNVDNKLINDLASAQQEFEGYIQALVDLEISTVSVFRPSENVTRAQFAKFLYNTINLEEVTTAGVKAINNTTVEVTFEDEIDDVKALKFTIDGLEVTNAVVKQTDKYTAVLTTAAQEGGKEYTVSVNEEEVGSFTGIAAVIPTAISLETTSVQGIVGKEVTVKAQVTVKEGDSKAGIPVTFNVDPYNANTNTTSSLNKSQVKEVTTDANGVATYTYTQYNAGEDQVVAYATGNASSRDFAKVYWGVKPILTLTTKDGVTVENGKAKTYTATYLDPVTGTPLVNKELNVTFKENIDASVNNDSSAVATDVNTGATAKPYESATSQSVLKVKTNAKGEATFTVTGSNTEVTPIVYLDSDALNTAGYNRINTRDLQATTETTKFVGGVYTFKFNKEEQFEAVVNKPFTYEVEVIKADGKPYAGGTATVALNELIDSSLSTNTTAYIVNNSKVKAIPGKSGVYTLQLDKDGKAKFDVQADRTEVSATPVVWVDINTASNIEGTLEKEEAFKLAGSVIFRNEVIGGAELENTSDVTGLYGVSGTGLQQPNYEIKLLDQAGADYSQADYAVNRVTYTLTNTGNSAVDLSLTATNFRIDTISNNNPSSSVVIAAGGSVTVTGSANGYPKDVALAVSNANAGTVTVTGSVTTNVLRSGTWTNHNSYYSAGTETSTWVAATPAVTEVTGVVKGYQTVDGSADWGYALVLVDGTSTYQIVKYDQSNSYFTGTQTDFNRLTATDAAGFETAISLEDRISLKNSEIRLINVDSSSKSTQVKGNVGTVTPPSTTITQAIVDAVNKSANVAAVKVALQNLSGFGTYIVADQDKIASDLFTQAQGATQTIATLNATYEPLATAAQQTVTAIATTKEAIKAAQAKHDAAVEGTAVGQYAVGSKATLQSDINTAQAALNTIVNGTVASTPGSAPALSNHAETLTNATSGTVKVLNDEVALFEATVVTDARLVLGNLLTEAKALIASGAQEGTKAGNYSINSLATLATEITTAQAKYDASYTSDADLRIAFTDLKTDLDAAKAAKIAVVELTADAGNTASTIKFTASPALAAVVTGIDVTDVTETAAGTAVTAAAATDNATGLISFTITNATPVAGDTIELSLEVTNVVTAAGAASPVLLTLEYDATKGWVVVNNANVVGK